MSLSQFALIAICIGILQSFEGWQLFKNRGRMTSLVAGLSIVETLWLCYLCYALFASTLPKGTLFLSASFLSFALISTWQVSQNNKDSEHIESVEDLVIPAKLCLASMAFGLYYALGHVVTWLITSH